MTALRVLHVVPGVSAKFGSPIIALTGLTRALRRLGVETAVCTTNADPDGRMDVPLGQPIVQDGVTYTYYDTLAVGGRYGLSPAMWRGLRRTVTSYDIVHIHWLYNFSSAAAARVAGERGVPFVVQPHGSLDPYFLQKNRAIKQSYLATIGRPLLRNSEAVIWTSIHERQCADPPPDGDGWVIPVGLDADGFTTLPPRGTFRRLFPRVQGPFLLLLGRITRQKGIDLLIPAFAKISHRFPDVQLVLAGPDDDGYRGKMEALARECRVDDRVIFTGMLSHDPKLAAFVDAELFVLPSYAENFGMVVTEALACGLPIVISDQVNTHGELRDAGVATVVTCSVDSVAGGIEAALSDSGLRQRIAKAGPAVVRERFTWDAIAPGLLKKYAKVIERAVKL